MNKKSIVGAAVLLGAVNLFARVAYAACICWVAVNMKDLTVMWWLLLMVLLPSVSMNYHSDDEDEKNECRTINH